MEKIYMMAIYTVANLRTFKLAFESMESLRAMQDYSSDITQHPFPPTGAVSLVIF
jgi:hypothetical protein